MDSIAHAELTTAHLADACLRLSISVRCGPHSLRPVAPNLRAGGRACPVQHFGSVDVFLEALAEAAPGEVMVVDNAGRIDEACVGDLVREPPGVRKSADEERA